MKERKQPTRRRGGEPHTICKGRLISGILMVFLWTVLHAAEVAAGAERAVIFYSPG